MLLRFHSLSLDVTNLFPSVLVEKFIELDRSSIISNKVTTYIMLNVYKLLGAALVQYFFQFSKEIFKTT